MASHSIGLIGYGNMGRALAAGMLKEDRIRESFPLTVFTRSAQAAEAARRAGANTAETPSALAAKGRSIIVAVKPHQVEEVLSGLQPFLTSEHIIISVAAGVGIKSLKDASGGKCPVVRAMPNTFVAVGRGLFALCFDDPDLREKDRDDLTLLFKALGETFVMPEKKIAAFAALAGCGPAYAFLFAEALIEAGVTLGFTRAESTAMSLSLLEGTGLLAKSTGTHPSLLREQVTSPGGMTIAGTNHLDRTAVRGHIIDAVLASWRRGLEMETE